MLSTEPLHHFKSMMCVWSLSPLLLLKQHYLGCRINTLNPPMPLSLIHPHSLSEGQARVWILTQISAMLGLQQLPDTILLLQGLISSSCHVHVLSAQKCNMRVCLPKSSVIYCRI